MMFYRLVMVAVMVAGAVGHTLHLGRTCPDVLPFPNLSVDKVLGRWYVLHKFDTDNTCLVWNVTRGEIPDTLLVTETRQLSVLDTLGVDHTHAVTAMVDIPNPEVPGKMRIRWPTSLTGKADFIVFDTDYETYMSVFECDRAGLLHRRSVTILSRTRTIDDMFVSRVRRLLDTADVSHSALSTISHDSCRQSGQHNWHVDEELFGLLPGVDEEEVRRRVSQGVVDYDITQVEIISDGVTPDDSSFRGSLRRDQSEPAV
ncbi:apolipoprotein D-like isoform X3 [Panulirus ornatus]|uniref:apolipoprotein D-like isoform X3 n=1 Tax=Panulirus ornatus TaxID=150431 RepID=UPI003A83D876